MAAGIRAMWAAADEVYGRSGEFRAALRALDLAYVVIILCRATTRTLVLSWCFLCSSGCSPVLADQVLDDVGALDAGGHTGRSQISSAMGGRPVGFG
jgi:hypothetical protein